MLISCGCPVAGAWADPMSLTGFAMRAEELGYHGLWTFQRLLVGAGEQMAPVYHSVLDPLLALTYAAARTTTIRLGVAVINLPFLSPAYLAKQATTLDVLSAGRSYFGIGAAWNEHESKGLGFPFPPLRERFESLEDTLRMAHEMWSGGSGTGGHFEGSRTVATHLINSPQSISRPRVPILVGGGGERKTLRLVAQYADACNLFGRSPEFVRAKLEVLREHCDRLGRPYDEIERTVLTSIDLDAETPEAVVERLGALGEAGAQHVIVSVRGVADTSRLERIGAEVLPQLR
jgi:alkanesulfonate monooxygenase SsuD/methylene tetrahydromethanopterin reductase-like flavin-dependent oxidoreductase (luciferase family)